MAALPPTTLADTDNDGLPDGVETPALLGTNPAVPDGRLLAKGNGQALAGVTTAGILPQATVLQAYATSLSGSVGTPPYSWSIVSGQLPDGLSLDSATGQIAGTPTAAGTFGFTYQVSSASGQVSVTSRIDVAAAAYPGSTAVPALSDWGTGLMGLLLAVLLFHLPPRTDRKPR